MDILQTARLIIRPLVMQDLEEVHVLLDQDLYWAGPGVSLDRRREKVQFQIALAQWTDTGGLYGDRAIVLKETVQLIGFCGFRPWLCTPAERTLYSLSMGIQDQLLTALELGIGYALSSQYRHQGYATEAVRALIDYGFNQLKVHRIVALTVRGNTESVGVMKRAGMKVGINPDPEVFYPWAVGMIENYSEAPQQAFAADRQSCENQG